MISLRVLLCDDEPLALERLSAMLTRITGVEVVASCDNGADAIRECAARKPDVVFLDIEMPNLNGFDVVEAIAAEPAAEHVPLVVFVTAYPQFATRAFETAAIDFLPKPLRRSRLEQCVDRCRDSVRNREAEARLYELQEKLNSLRSVTPSIERDSQCVWISRRGEFVRVDLDRIDWVRAEGEYVRLFAGESSYLYRQLMGSFEDRLNPAEFIRIHRSFIVRRSGVAAIKRSKHGSSVVQLRTGDELPVGRKYAKLTRQALFSAAQPSPGGETQARQKQ